MHCSAAIFSSWIDGVTHHSATMSRMEIEAGIFGSFDKDTAGITGNDGGYKRLSIDGQQENDQEIQEQCNDLLRTGWWATAMDYC